MENSFLLKGVVKISAKDKTVFKDIVFWMQRQGWNVKKINIMLIKITASIELQKHYCEVFQFLTNGNDE